MVIYKASQVVGKSNTKKCKEVMKKKFKKLHKKVLTRKTNCGKLNTVT